MISVCIATHNGEKYIKQQIDSIIHQIDSTDEIIISDDGSTDETLSILNSYHDKRIKILRYHSDAQKKHYYSNAHYKVSANFENALKHAKGDYIFLSDQDDIWIRNKVPILLSALQQNDLVMSNCMIIDGEGLILLEKYIIHNPISNNLYSNILNMPFMGCCMAFKRNILDIALPFPINCIMHDNWIGLLSCIKKKRISFLDESLIAYRRYDNNVSPIKGKSKNPFWFKIVYRIRMWYDLKKRYIDNR